MVDEERNRVTLCRCAAVGSPQQTDQRWQTRRRQIPRKLLVLRAHTKGWRRYFSLWQNNAFYAADSVPKTSLS